VPVLEYVAQLLQVDDIVQDAMTKAMRRLASGPGNWIELRDLENLTMYGLSTNMRTITATSKAAKLRLLRTVASDAKVRYNELQSLMAHCLRRPFGTWHNKSFYQILNDNRDELQRQGVQLESLHSKMKSPKGAARTNNEFQTVARRERLLA